MKRLFLFMLSCCLGMLSVYAQPNSDSTKRRGEQKIKALYIAYMSQELKLTEEEAQKFWPVHRQFDSEMRELHKQQLNDELEREEQSLAIKKKYRDKFNKVLGNERTQDFFKKDAEFRLRLLEKMKSFRQAQQKGGGMHRKRNNGNPPPKQ